MVSYSNDSTFISSEVKDQMIYYLDRLMNGFEGLIDNEEFMVIHREFLEFYNEHYKDSIMINSMLNRMYIDYVKVARRIGGYRLKP